MPSIAALADRAELSASLRANPGQILESMAERHGCSLADAVESLPTEMWCRCSGSRLVNMLQQIAGWNSPVTVIMHSADAIMEFSGPLPPGEERAGFYNLIGRHGLHGHIRAQNCSAIYLIERPFMGKDTASLLFCNADGAAMFKIFAGREPSGALLQPQVKALRVLMQQGGTQG